MRGGRGRRAEFSAFHASAYPQLAAQTLAITGDAGITRAATETTLTRVWRSWPSLRQAADLLVRARWTAVLVAAERESTAPLPKPDAVEAAVGELTGATEVTEDTVVVAALQRLPRVQRRALVLHYMGEVSVRNLAALSGSSAEHIELLLDDGFTALAESLDWSAPDEPSPGRGPDLRFDLAAEVLADTAARLPERISAPLPTALLRHDTVTHWSARAIPLAASAACAAVIAAVMQPASPEQAPPTIYAEHGSGTLDGTGGGSFGAGSGVAGGAPTDAARPDVGSGPARAAAPSTGPMVRMRSIALMSLLDTPDRGNSSRAVGPGLSDDARMRQPHLGLTTPSSPAPSSAEPSAPSSGPSTVSSSASSASSGGTAEATANGPSAGQPGASAEGPSDRRSGTAASPTPGGRAGAPTNPTPGGQAGTATNPTPGGQAGAPTNPTPSAQAGAPASGASGGEAGGSATAIAGPAVPSGPATGAATSSGPMPSVLAVGIGGPSDASPSDPAAVAVGESAGAPTAAMPVPGPVAALAGGVAPLVGGPSAKRPATSSADLPSTDRSPALPTAADPSTTPDPPIAVQKPATTKPGSEKPATKTSAKTAEKSHTSDTASGNGKTNSRKKTNSSGGPSVNVKADQGGDVTHPAASG